MSLTFPGRLLPSGFVMKAVYKFLFFRVCATCPAHHMSLDLTTLTMLVRSTSHKIVACDKDLWLSEH
jgi:hypothetical protein